MKKVAFAALVGLSMTTVAHGADLASGQIAGGSQYEIGSGWYIRGDFGEALGVGPSVNGSSITAPPPGDASNAIAPTYGASAHQQQFTFGGGFGYQFNSNFRVDATFDHFTSVSFGYVGQVVCPYSATGIYQTIITATGTISNPLGILYDPTNTCNGVEKISNTNNVALVNAYYDLPAFYGLAPYVGAGVGMNFFHTSGTLGYFKTSDGSSYNADLSLPGGYPAVWVNAQGQAVPNPGIAFSQQNWNRTLSQTKITMAIALMAGVSYHFNDWVALDVGYRYLNANISQPGSNYSNEIRAGLRIYAN